MKTLNEKFCLSRKASTKLQNARLLLRWKRRSTLDVASEPDNDTVSPRWLSCNA